MAFTVKLHKKAEFFLRSLKGTELDEVRRRLDLIQDDPLIDDRVKLALPMPPAILTLYDDGGDFRIVYHVPSSVLIRVWSITRAGEELKL